MPLTEQQRNQLIERINSLSMATILPYFQSGEISFEDVPGILPERRQYIEEQLSNMPNMVEQQEWSLISQMLQNDSADIAYNQQLLGQIDTYIRNWEASRPNGNHVDEALGLRATVEGRIREIAAQIESNDWNNVDMFSKSSLLGHLSRYPNTVHLNDIDNAIWGITVQDNEQDLNDYLNIFPSGLHSGEASQLRNAITEWNYVRNTNDIFAANSFLQNNPSSPFRNQCQMIFLRLKDQEMAEMKRLRNAYDVKRLMDLLDANIVSRQELIMSGIVTDNVLKTIQNMNINQELPDISQAIASSTAECKPGYTDVYFFGIPSTGKTCVLMGLTRSDSLHLNLAAGGGEYTAALQMYTDAGVAVPPTPGDFVTTLEASISRQGNESVDHKVNLVEMSGEEFAFHIANNPDHIFTFENMGTGTTELLNNDNRKVFFLIIDPTANIVRFMRESQKYDASTGQNYVDYQQCIVNQRTLIQKIVNIFQDPGNAEIMKKVDTIHIIMTKADTLGGYGERDIAARNIFDNQYGNNILGPLVDLCKEYNINAHTNFRPKLYTFSLGTFYVGSLYEYDPTDSNRLVKAIRNSTHGTKKKSWWDRLKEVVN